MSTNVKIIRSWDILWKLYQDDKKILYNFWSILRVFVFYCSLHYFQKYHIQSLCPFDSTIIYQFIKDNNKLFNKACNQLLNTCITEDSYIIKFSANNLYQLLIEFDELCELEAIAAFHFLNKNNFIFNKRIKDINYIISIYEERKYT